MQDNFEASLKHTLVFEGGKVDDPADKGGRTNRGVTQRIYDAYRKKNGRATTDVYLITDIEVEDIYHNQYWITTHGDSNPYGVDFAAFDYGVNSGPSRAVAATPKDLSDPVDAVKTICKKRTSFVNAIKNFSKFRKGVLARVAKVEALGVAMAHPHTVLPPALKPTLQAEAAKATKKAQNKAATATVAAPAVVVSPAVAPVPTSYGLYIAALIAVIAVALLIWLIYEYKRHSARADAYTEVANAS